MIKKNSYNRSLKNLAKLWRRQTHQRRADLFYEVLGSTSMQRSCERSCLSTGGRGLGEGREGQGREGGGAMVEEGGGLRELESFNNSTVFDRYIFLMKTTKVNIIT